MTVQEYIHTSLVGSKGGNIFNDILLKQDDGSIIVNDEAGSPLDLTHPIKEITIYFSNSVIHGLEITYQLQNQRTFSVKHGSGPVEGGQEYPFTLGANDIVTGVYGRTGTVADSGTDDALILSLGFVLSDKQTGVVGAVGPFGNGNAGVDPAASFYASDVIGFGGFAKDDAESYGLSGLYFFKNVGAN